MQPVNKKKKKKMQHGEKGRNRRLVRRKRVSWMHLPAWYVCLIRTRRYSHPCYLSRQHRTIHEARIHSRAMYTGGGNDDGYLAQSAHDRSMSPSFPPSGELLLGCTATTVCRFTPVTLLPLLSPPCCCVHSALRATTLQPLSSYAPVVAAPSPRPSHLCFCPRQGENGSGAGGTRGWRR